MPGVTERAAKFSADAGLFLLHTPVIPVFMSIPGLRTPLAHALLCLIAMIEQLFSGTNYQATKQLLDAAVTRHEALAANISNVETPGYKRVDLPKDFTHEFSSYVQSGGKSSAPVATIVEDAAASSRRKDGNTVQLDKELLAMNKNEAEYETLTEFVSGSIKQLKLAITGHSA